MYFDVILLLVLVLFLIGMFVFFRGNVRRAMRLQEKQTELVEQQVAVLRQTNDLLKRLVESR
jgi:hypothetical protein